MSPFDLREYTTIGKNHEKEQKINKLKNQNPVG